MTSPGESWHISKIANEARRAIESLDLDTQERILAALESLQTGPFSGDVKRIKGKREIYRLRSGRFRVYFRTITDYFTGIEDVNAVLAMTPKTKEAFLFLPKLTANQITGEGPNLLEDKKAKEKTGFADILLLTYLDEFMAWNASRQGYVFFLQMAPREAYASFARRSMLHYNDQDPIDIYRYNKLKERFPAFELKDMTPMIDSLRVIKSAEEAEILRKNGKISAEGSSRRCWPQSREFLSTKSKLQPCTSSSRTGRGRPPIHRLSRPA